MDTKHRSKNFKYLAIALSVIIVVSLIFVAIILKNNTHTEEQLKNEEPLIAAALNEKFAFLSNNYVIDKTVILGGGKYAAVLLTLDLVTYRALLINNDQIWTVEGLPSPVLFYDDFPDIPKEIIRTINALEVD